jgi:pyrroloquinoline quinone biosynthesis protein B
MRVRVLGSAAGGGFPQWNCNCRNCEGLRQGRVRAAARTQSSIAVTGDSRSWVLCNASPDILTQLKAFPAAQPGRAIRDTGLAAVVLVDAQVDHTTGLVMLREGKPLEIWCSARVEEDLMTGYPILPILRHYCGVHTHRLPFAPEPFTIPKAPGLRFTAVPLKSKAPPYSPHREAPGEGDNIGLRVEDTATGRNLFYAPGFGEMEPHLAPYLAQADCLMLDGTFWTDDEMLRLGIAPKGARELGHLPQSGPGGMLELLAPLARPRKILIHINNTNPILNEDSPQRRELDAHGIEVSYDGMDITL